MPEFTLVLSDYTFKFNRTLGDRTIAHNSERGEDRSDYNGRWYHGLHDTTY